MPSLVVENFKGGLDARHLPETTLPGSLLKLENGAINEGGEIEKLRAWVNTYSIPSGTYGMATIDEQIYVFGQAASAPSGFPQQLKYQQQV